MAAPVCGKPRQISPLASEYTRCLVGRLVVADGEGTGLVLRRVARRGEEAALESARAATSREAAGEGVRARGALRRPRIGVAVERAVEGACSRAEVPGVLVA